MPDPRFFISAPALSTGDVMSLVSEAAPDAKLISSDQGVDIVGVGAPTDSVLSAMAVFCESKAVAETLSGKKFGLCFTSNAFATDLADQGHVIVTQSAKLCFAILASHLHRPRTVFDSGAKPIVDPSANIHPSAVIGAGAEIGAQVEIGPLSAVGPGVVIGEHTIIGSGASVSFALIGRHSNILSGARIGEDGFGFVPGPAGPVRLPQLGRVLIGDEVEIGANSTVDRGTLEDTVIGDGCKIDNLVQIGHNVKIGRRVIFASQAGVSGSADIGDDVIVGGQVGITEGVVVNNGAKIAGQSGVMRDVPAAEIWGGTPAQVNRDWLRGVAAVSRLTKKKRSDPS